MLLYFSEHKVTLSLKIIYLDQKLKINSLFNKKLYKYIFGKDNSSVRNWYHNLKKGKIPVYT